MTQPTTAKTADDELANEATRRILRFALSAALAGAGARAAIGAARSGGPTYDRPEAPKPLVVDMPYPVRGPVDPADIPLPGREKKDPGQKMLAAGSPPKAAAELPDWARAIPFGESIHGALPTYTPPLGRPGETDPSNVPALGALYPLAGIAGAAGGFKLTDTVLRAADRRDARSELDDAKREYQNAVIARIAKSHLPAKAAADVRAATDALYDVLAGVTAVKAADDPVPVPATPAPGAEKPHGGLRALASLLWPGLVAGPDAARANMALAGAVGGLGAWGGYNFARDEGVSNTVRKRIRDVENANAAQIPSPVVGRLVPVGSQ